MENDINQQMEKEQVALEKTHPERFKVLVIDEEKWENPFSQLTCLICEEKFEGFEGYHEACTKCTPEYNEMTDEQKMERRHELSNKQSYEQGPFRDRSEKDEMFG